MAARLSWVFAARSIHGRFSSDKEARTLRDIAADLESERRATVNRVNDLRDRAAKLRESAGSAQDARASTHARLAEIDAAIAALQADGVDEPQDGDSVEYKTAKSRRIAECIRINIQSHATKIDNLMLLITAADQAAATAKTELAALAPAGDLESLRARRAIIAASRSQLAADIKARADFEGMERAFATTADKAKAKLIAWEVAKAVTKAVATIRDDMMARLSRPVTDRMNRFLGYCAPAGAVAYCDIESSIGREVCDFGWVRNGRKVTIRAMSGGERTMFAAALQYALVTLTYPPLKLLLIEGDQCDMNNLLRLTTACEAVSGELSNVLLTCHAGDILTMHGWNVLRIGVEPPACITDPHNVGPNLRIVKEEVAV